MKITNATTLGQLEVLKLQYGVSSIHEIPHTPLQNVRVIVITEHDGEIYGRGHNFIEALDDGFQQLIARTGARLSAPQSGVQRH